MHKTQRLYSGFRIGPSTEQASVNVHHHAILSIQKFKFGLTQRSKIFIIEKILLIQAQFWRY
jgi:hypothetical protein